MGDGATLQALIEEEQVNFSAGVPTVWLGLLASVALAYYSIYLSKKVIEEKIPKEK